MNKKDKIQPVIERYNEGKNHYYMALCIEYDNYDCVMKYPEGLKIIDEETYNDIQNLDII